jgi:hypothetical protein
VIQAKTEGGKEYKIIIKRVGSFDLEEVTSTSSDKHNLAVHFINLIIKKALRNMELKQIGRMPKFFMPEQKKSIEKHCLDMWPGF